MRCRRTFASSNSSSPRVRSSNCPPAQHNYLSANYTHVAREVLARGVNVIAHLVARRTLNGQLQLSLGSNPDVTVDLLPRIDAGAP